MLENLFTKSIFILNNFKDSDIVNSAIAFFLLLEGFLYNIGALKEESLKLSMIVGILKLFLSSFIIRMNFELHQIKEK